MQKQRITKKDRSTGEIIIKNTKNKFAWYSVLLFFVAFPFVRKHIAK